MAAVNEELQTARRRWDELGEMVLADAGRGGSAAFDAVGELELDDLRFMVLERLLRDVGAAPRAGGES